MKKQFRVFHNRGGSISVFAQDKEDAIEEYYRSLESIIGHHLKICGCFGERKPIDRKLVARPTKIEEIGPWQEQF